MLYILDAIEGKLKPKGLGPEFFLYTLENIRKEQSAELTQDQLQVIKDFQHHLKEVGWNYLCSDPG